MRALRLFFFLLVSSFFLGCEQEETLAERIERSPSVLRLVDDSLRVEQVIDGELERVRLLIEIVGDELQNVEFPIIVRLVADEMSTALPGKHYEADDLFVSGVELTEQNFLKGFAEVEIKLLADDILAIPFKSEKRLGLSLEAASYSSSVLSTVVGLKTIWIDINYTCGDDLSGTYIISNSGEDDWWCYGTYDWLFPAEIRISKNFDGSWHLEEADGGFWLCHRDLIASSNSGNVSVDCGLVAPSDDMRYGSLNIGNILGGTWDPDSGILRMKHVQTFIRNWPDSWNSTYIRIGD